MYQIQNFVLIKETRKNYNKTDTFLGKSHPTTTAPHSVVLMQVVLFPVLRSSPPLRAVKLRVLSSKQMAGVDTLVMRRETQGGGGGGEKGGEGSGQRGQVQTD